ncbi:MAG: DNA mismatch repair endonuclease MutL [Prevotella sp.]
MSDIIQLLPDSVANQIAAGEVIQRPASVVKELVENSVDAGAKTINVLVVDAGRTSIQVIDDGKGMSETDARLSFERHATSKIRQADDLFALHTMGFRGEALASIAAVAQVELKTRTQDDEVGTHLSIAGSKVTGQEPCACPVGSNFLIENLFYNVPARRKFLKSNNTELNNIIAAFQRIALVYPQINFTLHSNGTEMYNLHACGLRQRICDIFGMRINPTLLPVKIETSVCSILGFVGKPEAARKKGARQYFFVNGRYMRHPYFHKAVMVPYERLIAPNDQIPYFIYFTVDPKDVDVNIHPTKTEIKFENEKEIWQILAATVKDALGMFNDVSTLDFDTEGKPDIPVFDPNNSSEMPHFDLNPDYNPFKQQAQAPAGMASPDYTPEFPSKSTAQTDDFSGGISGSGMRPDGAIPAGGGYVSRMGHMEQDYHKAEQVRQWEQLYQGLRKNNSQQEELFPEKPVEESPLEEKSPVHYQYKGKYIMTAVKSGLMIVDQHRAHVRILFEQYQRQMNARKMHSQKILFPHSIHLDRQEELTYKQVEQKVLDAGFELTPLGGDTYAVNAIPEGLEGVDVPHLLHEILSSPEHEDGSVMQEFNDRMALRLAQAAAVPYGQVLDNKEMEDIINKLFSCSNTNYTPNGKTILCILKQTQIEQMLG